MPRIWRGIVDCDSCHVDKATVKIIGRGRLCGHCWARCMWGKAWADKCHPDHPHAKATAKAGQE